MKVTIQKNSSEHDEFVERWEKLCVERKIDYDIVNATDSNSLDSILTSDVFLFHWSLHNIALFPIMKELSSAISYSKVKTFPDFHTCWHYDDKIAEYFLFRALGIHTIPTHIFTDSSAARKWLNTKNYPIIAKLRMGAGSMNVFMIRSSSEGRALINKAFKKGLPVINRYHIFRDKMQRFIRKPSFDTFKGFGRGFARLFVPTKAERVMPRQRNCVLFQDFVPNLDHDIRVIVVGSKAVAIKRLVREGDFRASGSGLIIYDHKQIPISTVRDTFISAAKLGMQSCAMDYIQLNGVYVAVEVSFDFVCAGYDKCPGYWDKSLTWHFEKIDMATQIFDLMTNDS